MQPHQVAIRGMGRGAWRSGCRDGPPFRRSQRRVQLQHGFRDGDRDAHLRPRLADPAVDLAIEPGVTALASAHAHTKGERSCPDTTHGQTGTQHTPEHGNAKRLVFARPNAVLPPPVQRGLVQVCRRVVLVASRHGNGGALAHARVARRCLQASCLHCSRCHWTRRSSPRSPWCAWRRPCCRSPSSCDGGGRSIGDAAGGSVWR